MFKEIRNLSPGKKGRKEGRKVEGRCHSYKQVKVNSREQGKESRSWARELKTRLD